MTPDVSKMVAATYVRDIATSRAFYQLIGFHEHQAGTAPTSAWSVLHSGDYLVLLASTQPYLDVPELPLLFYFYVADVDAVHRTLRESGLQVAHVGCPPHALGGELRLRDPDGNTILIGQEQRSASQAEPADDGSPHFSLLKEAAAAVAARGGTGTSCHVNNADKTRCPAAAEVKLADSAGSAVWACLEHAHEILLRVPSAFITNHDNPGIAEFLGRRHATSQNV